MEIKQEIVALVNRLPNEILADLLQYLQQVEKTSSDKMKLSINLHTILTEDHDVLKKLAE